jgi:hypothetical protein
VGVDADGELLGIELVAWSVGGPSLIVANHTAEAGVVVGVTAGTGDGVFGTTELWGEAAEAPFGAADV